MRKLLKPKLLFLFFWGIVVFASILILPNIATFVNEQTTIPQNQTTSDKYQQQWGHGLAGTQSLTLVFNNPNGKLTNQQQRQITATLAKLNQKADDYGIDQLRTSTGMRNDRHLLCSNDGSTELALVTVQSARADLAIIANQLNNAIASAHLSTSVTSSDLIYQQHLQQQRRELIISFLIGSLVSLLVLGFNFRSLLVPLLNLLCQAVTLITTVSLITNGRITWHLPLTAAALGIAGMASLLLTSILTWHFMHTYWQSAANQPPATVSLRILTSQYRQWPLIIIPIMLVTLALHWTALISLAAAWAITVALMMTLLAVPTLNYAFTALLGDNLFWPSHHSWQPWSHNLWGQFSRFSHWQPALGLLAGAILIGPGLINANSQFADDELRPWHQTQLTNAELGQQLVQAHFGIGATEPITITLRSTHDLTQQRSLQTLDQLTTKLQAVPNVARVISVTQPIGRPLSSFYVNQQLTTLNIDLAGKQASVIKLQKQLTTAQTHLNEAATRQHSKSVDSLSDRLNALASLNDQLTQQLQTIDTNLQQSATQPSTSAQLNHQFTKLAQLTDQMTTALNRVVAAQTTVATEAGHVDQRVHRVNQSLKQTVQPLQTLLTSLQHTHAYLDGLATSQVGHSFYLPTSAATNQSYQNSLFTNISSDLRMTQFTITLTTAPTSATSRQTLQQLKRVTRASLLTTPLAKATILTTGVTQQQQRHHALIQQHGLKWLALGGIILGLALWLGLRSFTQAALITSGLILLTLTSWGWTQLIMVHWLQLAPLSSHVLLASLVILSLHWLTITVVTVNHQDWFHHFDTMRLQQHFYYCGQLVWPITLLACGYLLPLLAMGAPNLKAMALMSLFGIGLSNLIVPLTFPGLVSWTVNPPAWPKLKRRHSS